MVGNFCINNIVGLILLMFRCVDGDLNDCWNGWFKIHSGLAVAFVIGVVS